MTNSLISQFNPKPTFLRSNPVRSSTHFRPNVIKMAQTQSYWTSIESDVQTYLKQAITIRPPESVFEPMHELTFTAPKTTASTLCVAACELLGGDRSHAMAAAAAIHLIHVASWTHEHLPLTDRPKSMSKPSIEHKFGPNIELLTGDGIVPFGLELLSRPMGDNKAQNSDKILRVILEISKTGGAQGLVEGQFHELGVVDNDYEMIEYVARKKEGELHACGAACGAILGGGNEEEVEKLRKFGLHLGMVKGILGRNKPGFMEDSLERLRGLAVKELESFESKKRVELIRLLELQNSLANA